MQNKESHPLNTPKSITKLETNLTGLPNKAMGRYRIHDEMLKNLNQNDRITPLKLLKISFNTGYLPTNWKNAAVVPILKRNKPANLPESYRPISLTSCFGKMMERIINNRLKWYNEKTRLLPILTGFRNGCTTNDNLLRLETAIITGFDNKKTISAIFQDLAKAMTAPGLLDFSTK
jgi:hypothetical protein